MKQLRTWALVLLGLGACTGMAALVKPESSTPVTQQPVIMNNHRSVTMPCKTQPPNPQIFAYHNDCEAAANRQCIRTECPPPGTFLQNKWPKATRCVRDGQVVAIATDCTEHQNGSICVPTACPQ